MKILIAATDGASLQNFRGKLIEDWVRLGHKVHCVSIEPYEEMSLQMKKLNSQYYQVRGSRTDIGICSGIRMINKYRKVFKIIKPDICFLYMSKPIVFGGIAAINTRVPKINILVNGLENAYYQRGIKARIIRIIMTVSYTFVGGYCDKVFFQNPSDMKRFIDSRIISEKKAVLVNGSGVDMEFFNKCPLPEKPVLLMVSRMLWSKGIREFLEAIKIVREKHFNIEVLLVGALDPENDESLSEKELELAINEYNITYCGHADDVRPFLTKSSIFVLPSYHEGMPRSILEAMATGRPIITTDAPGCVDTVVDGVNGYIVPVKDVAILAEKMCALIENPNLRTSMSQKSYEICCEKFEVHKINQTINEELGLLG